MPADVPFGHPDYVSSYTPLGSSAWTPGGSGYSLAGGSYADQLNQISLAPPVGAAPSSTSIPQPTPGQVMSVIGQALQLGFEIASQVHGQVTGINPATGQAYTATGTVPAGQLGQTSITGPGGSIDLGASEGLFGGANVLVLAGIGLLAVVLLADRRR